MSNVIMFETKTFEENLTLAGLNQDQIDLILSIGTPFDNKDYSIIQLAKPLSKTGKVITISREVITIAGTAQKIETHFLNIDGETPIEINGPKIPPRLGD